MVDPVSHTADPVATVVETLAAHGRTVEPDVVRAELMGLQGLATEDAVTTLLACYGIVRGQPARTFVKDYSAASVVKEVIGEVRASLSFVLAAGLLAVIPALAVPFAMRFFVDRYVVAGKHAVGPYLVVGLFGAALLTVALMSLQLAVLHRSYLRMSAVGQTGFVWHTLRMRPDELARQAPGDVIARMGAKQRMSVQGGMLFPLAAVNIINATAYALAVWTLDTAMFAATLLVAGLTAIASLRILASRSAKQNRADEAMSDLSATVTQTVSAMESVKAAAWEQSAFQIWSVGRARMAVALSNLGVANQWLVFIPALGLALGLGAVLAIGTWQVIQGDLSLGTLVAAQSFVAMLLESVGLLIYVGALLQSTASAGQQSDAVMRTVLDPESLEPLNPEPVTRLRGDVRLRAISFGYDRQRPALIEDLDLHVPAGHRVALVGASGSGKTTIARLLTGELRPWAGTVEFDDVPRLRLPRSVKSAAIAYVPQRPTLFTGTIHDNLTLWNPEIPDDQVRKAAQDACIEAAILSRPGGYYAMVTADSGFSGGERQRLAIARALAGNPSVLILDEATSALDPVVELQVEQNLRERACTCVVVAHRLSTVRDAQEILVVDAGRIVQRGRFEDIVGEGPFAELMHG
jgi:ABC-type bacteriocin/lantibiotic exporter with double-glycine peptidase domain